MDTVLHDADLRNKARDTAYQKLWVGAYRDYFMEFPKMLKNGVTGPQVGIIDNYIKKLRCGWEFAFFVVNFREDVELEYILEKVKKCISKVWIKNYIWNIEQRGCCDRECGKGLHFNLMIELGSYKRASDMKREIWNTFKHMVGNKMHVVGRYAHDGENFKNYAMGIKKDGDKDEMMIYDRVYRVANGLENFYSNYVDCQD